MAIKVKAAPKGSFGSGTLITLVFVVLSVGLLFQPILAAHIEWVKMLTLFESDIRVLIVCALIFGYFAALLMAICPYDILEKVAGILLLLGMFWVFKNHPLFFPDMAKELGMPELARPPLHFVMYWLSFISVATISSLIALFLYKVRHEGSGGHDHLTTDGDNAGPTIWERLEENKRTILGIVVSAAIVVAIIIVLWPKSTGTPPGLQPSSAEVSTLEKLKRGILAAISNTQAAPQTTPSHNTPPPVATPTPKPQPTVTPQPTAIPIPAQAGSDEVDILVTKGYTGDTFLPISGRAVPIYNKVARVSKQVWSKTTEATIQSKDGTTTPCKKDGLSCY